MTINNFGILYIIATPIGNLQDISYRAIDTLKTVTLIAAEDTRHTKNLLKKFNIYTATTSFHKYNEVNKTKKIIQLLKQKSIALVSDAGTPAINDPGYKLIKQCHKEHIRVVPIPGPCALITALSVSGLSGDQFSYQGFLPKKHTLRITVLESINNHNTTIIFYESCHRILATMQDIIDTLGSNRIIVLAKEITKKWETIKYGTSIEILLWLKKDQSRIKGEIIILIKGIKTIKNQISPVIKNTFLILNKQLSIKQSIVLTSKIYNINKNILYQYVIKNIMDDKK